MARENYKRHRSEHLLDRFILKAEIKQIAILNQMMGKIRKPIPEKQKKVEPKKEQKTPNKEAEIDPYDTIIKVQKYLWSSAKHHKSLLVILELLKAYIDKIDPSTCFMLLDQISHTAHLRYQEETAQIAEKIFLFALAYSEDNAPYFSELECRIIEAMQLPMLLLNQINTDDSFEFHNVIKEMNKIFEEVSAPFNGDEYLRLIKDYEKLVVEVIISNKKVKDTINSTDSETADFKNIYCQAKDVHALQMCIKRSMLCTLLLNISKRPLLQWTKNSLIMFIKQLYIGKDAFTSEQQEQLISIMSFLQGKSISIDGHNHAGKLRDQKIKSTPLESYYKVSDGRSWVFSTGNLDQWSDKQFGVRALDR